MALALAACSNVESGTPGDTLTNPPEIRSHDGVLDGTLAIEPATAIVAGEEVRFDALYDGLYMPPILRVNPGDVVRLGIDNRSTRSINTHYHGLNVSPQPGSDDVFLDIGFGESYRYDMQIPANHPAGLFWYHPHWHPFTNKDIAGGLSGGLVVGDILAPFPELRGIPEQFMLLKDLKQTIDGRPEPFPAPAGPTRRTINGYYQPNIAMRPGQIQLWRFGAIGSNIYYRIRMASSPSSGSPSATTSGLGGTGGESAVSVNHHTLARTAGSDGRPARIPTPDSGSAGQRFYIIAQDGNLQNQAIETEDLVLEPGKRLEVLVYGPPAGSYDLVAEPFDTGPQGDAYPGQLLGTVVSGGDPVTPIPIPKSFPVVRDLRRDPISRTRDVIFSDTNDPNVFTIDGKSYDPSCVDTVIRLGDVERWRIQNTSPEAHVFHIHQLDYQVVAVDGAEAPFVGYQDTVSLPPAKQDPANPDSPYGIPSTVEVIIPFTDPVIVGEFVYHCHIMQHADQGMMANILVYDPAKPMPDHASCDAGGGNHGSHAGHGG